MQGKLKIFFLIIFMLSIFFSSLVATDLITKEFAFLREIHPIFQDLIHIPIFMAFTVLLLIVLRRYEKLRANQIVSAFILSNYVGVANEWIQMGIAGRCASFKDIGLNIVGSVFGIAIYYKLVRANRGKHSYYTCRHK